MPHVLRLAAALATPLTRGRSECGMGVRERSGSSWFALRTNVPTPREGVRSTCYLVLVLKRFLLMYQGAAHGFVHPNQII